jgi:hypothetical protein
MSSVPSLASAAAGGDLLGVHPSTLRGQLLSAEGVFVEILNSGA